jgi:hypothetical protein
MTHDTIAAGAFSRPRSTIARWRLFSLRKSRFRFRRRVARPLKAAPRQ